MAALIRPRRDEDITGCITILAGVHAADGYPVNWPDDPGAWLTPVRLIAALVAEVDGALAGHLVLQSVVGDPAAVQWSAAAELPPERLCAVGRLFVAPAARGHGVGSALLAAAEEEARARGLRAALEVHERDHAAIALYERRGWRFLGSVPWALDNGELTALRRYISPA